MKPLTFQQLWSHSPEQGIILERLEDVPPTEDLVALAGQRDCLTLHIATQLTSHSANSSDAPTLFLKALKEKLIPLLPRDRAVRTYTFLRNPPPQNGSEDGMLASWSCIKIYRTWTEEQVLQIAPMLAVAARDYDHLATDLMVRLATHLGDTPEGFAADCSYWCQYEQTGRMDPWGYFFHGIHCAFGNKDVWRLVEAAQGCANVTGYGFGVLDGHFLAEYCRHTPAHAAVLISPHDISTDWERIFEVSAKHGYLQVVSLRQGWSTGFVATPD